MMFTDKQNEQLAAKLDPKHVKKVDKGSYKADYVDSHHVISEANRIFGFDGWHLATLLNECVYSGETKLRNGAIGYTATYRAQVRITVGTGVERDGTGCGDGTSMKPGDAHESAIKEAETDAMKRAFRTFGNTFGLALYDKSKQDVGVPVSTSPPLPHKAPTDTEIHKPVFVPPTIEERIRDLERIRVAVKTYTNVLDLQGVFTIVDEWANPLAHQNEGFGAYYTLYKDEVIRRVAELKAEGQTGAGKQVADALPQDIQDKVEGFTL